MVSAQELLLLQLKVHLLGQFGSCSGGSRGVNRQLGRQNGDQDQSGPERNVWLEFVAAFCCVPFSSTGKENVALTRFWFRTATFVSCIICWLSVLPTQELLLGHTRLPFCSALFLSLQVSLLRSYLVQRT